MPPIKQPYFRSALAGVGLLALAAVAHTQSVKPLVELDHRLVLQGQRQTLYMLVEFDVAATRAQTQQRPRMNLALVLDRSGSMNDKGKMEYAKQAAKIVVDRLGPNDQLAVVEYDDQITVLWPSSPVEAPHMIKARIDALSPRGSTNLAGGMMQGAAEVLDHLLDGQINRVLLLSDGLANHGVTHPAEIGRMARETRRKGVGISTMGLGLDYNEDLMQAIAERAGGNYYYIENPTQMSRIFQQEMATLFATVAQKVEIRFAAAAAVDKVEVFGFAAETNDNRTRIAMEDFYADEKRSLLLRLEIAPQPAGLVPLGQLQLSYVDQLDGQRRELTLDPYVRATADVQRAAASRNDSVVVEASLIEADQQHEDYIRLYEQGRKEEAQAKINALASALAGKNADLDDIQLAKKVEALQMETEEMAAAELSQEARSSYLKQSKQRAYKAVRGKRGTYLLQQGDAGYEVERLQEALRDLQLYDGAIDGQFSAALAAAVKAFQRQQALKDDGVAGPQTLKALDLY